MKNYLLLSSLLAVIFGCGPTETQQNDMTELVTEWKSTSAKAISLYEEVGDKNYVVNSTESEGNEEEMGMITYNNQETSCEAAYESLNTSMGEFIATWKEQSQKVDDLTSSMSTGKWSDEDQELMESLKQERAQKDTQIEQWKEELKQLNQQCGLDTEALVIQEQES
ncbi:hypothetical protein SAMN04489724_2012 [Algoriphagus locisalis]|uniref:Uncharacterized protein n=1 Tax=Algoriphagus locisalis TaxID=305507 RepID=A0A1I7AJE0_9BACT|nr:hypothetical protein [Algoriphagus locisalis]SFT75028.1 hypothetical protein SAMN04489724_2012 [Algoriphagus locisalis]